MGPRGLPKGYAPKQSKMGKLEGKPSRRRERHGQRLGLGSSMVWKRNYNQFGMAGNYLYTCRHPPLKETSSETARGLETAAQPLSQRRCCSLPLSFSYRGPQASLPGSLTFIGKHPKH